MNAEEIIKEIYDNGTPVGSRAWGGSTKESDYDFIVPESWYNEFRSILLNESNFYEVGKYVYSNNIMYNKYNVKGVLNGLTINLLVYEDELISTLSVICLFMESLEETHAGQVIMRNKSNRIKLFDIALQEFLGEKRNMFGAFNNTGG